MSTEEEAVAVYTALHDQYVKAPYVMTRAWTLLSHRIGSDRMIKVSTV